MSSVQSVAIEAASSAISSPQRARSQSGGRIISVIGDLTRHDQNKYDNDSAVTKDKDSAVTENEALERCWSAYKGERNFSKHPKSRYFAELLQLLATVRATQWLYSDPCDQHRVYVLRCLRLLFRDEAYQAKALEIPNVLPALAESCKKFVEVYFSTRDTCIVEALTELTNIFQKLANSVCYHSNLFKEGIHHSLVQLLSCHDLAILQCSLNGLINFCKEPMSCRNLCQLDCTEKLLYLLQYSNTESKHLASDLLLLLSQEAVIRDQMADLDGLGLCLRLLHSKDLRLLHRLVKILDSLAEDVAQQEAIRGQSNEGQEGTGREGWGISEGAGGGSDVSDAVLSLRAACCSTIAQLVLNDASSQLVVKGNGIYLISAQLFPTPNPLSPSKHRENLCLHALRALRFLFSLERNRKLFKTLFPEKVFEVFIDIGNYTKTLKDYEPVMKMISSLPTEEQQKIRLSIEELNKNKSPVFSIGNYYVYELLGKGAFGQVYRVMKHQTESYYAMKEIRMDSPALGKNSEERTESVGKIMNEVNIIKEQLSHPNIVKYHKCFQEGNHLYIVMELLEGAPLIDHIVVLREKRERFSEARMWRIFGQLIQGLRYLHKEKKIVHRDLTPANVMVTEGDKLTITDFGLAKQKDREFSVLKSTVGTILYWCPELVNSEPYNEKADIWAAGCIFYQMAMLQPPFQSGNVLALAKKIAEVEYARVPTGLYSETVTQVIERCLTANPQCRPDSVEVGAMMCEMIMKQVDELAFENMSLIRRLAREKDRVSKYIQQCYASNEYKHGRLEDIQSTIGTMQARRCLLSQLGEDNNPMEEVDDEQMHRSNESLFVDDEQEKSGSPSTTKIALTKVAATNQCHSLDVDTSDTGPRRTPSQSAVVAMGTGSATIRYDIATPPRARAKELGFRQSVRSASQQLRESSPHFNRGRSHSVTSLLSVNSQQVREIADPISQLMSQVHKLLYINQLPPSSFMSMRRTLVERFEHNLFAYGTSAGSLKVEIHKLMTGSNEIIDLFMQENLANLSLKAMAELAGSPQSKEQIFARGEGHCISYEDLQAIIESLLVEAGYYQPCATEGTLIEQHYLEFCSFKFMGGSSQQSSRSNSPTPSRRKGGSLTALLKSISIRCGLPKRVRKDNPQSQRGFRAALEDAVLQQFLKKLAADPQCQQLLLIAWYLNDGALAGPGSTVLRALEVLEVQNFVVTTLRQRESRLVFFSIFYLSYVTLKYHLATSPVCKLLLRDCFANLCSEACLSLQLEKGPGLDFSRPADVLVPNWSLSNPATFDLKVIHLLNTDLILEVSLASGQLCRECLLDGSLNSPDPSHYQPQDVMTSQLYGRLHNDTPKGQVNYLDKEGQAIKLPSKHIEGLIPSHHFSAV
ncbi:hypothetical protein EMCRGX_G013410 [Ephydatia muelleri]